MGFLGPVRRVGGVLVRPHDLDLYSRPTDGAVRGPITRVGRVGFEMRVDVAVGGGSVLVTLTRTHYNRLGLDVGDTVWLRPAIGAPTVAVGNRAIEPRAVTV